MRAKTREKDIYSGKPDVAAHFPEPGRIGRGQSLLIPSVFCSCHCFSFPITLHLYYNSARGKQQGCRCLGTFCLEVGAGRPLFCCGEEKTSSHIPPEKWSKWRQQSRIFSQIFFHLCDAAENGAPHRALIRTFGFGNFPVGHAEDKVSVHPVERLNFF